MKRDRESRERHASSRSDFARERRRVFAEYRGLTVGADEPAPPRSARGRRVATGSRKNTLASARSTETRVREARRRCCAGPTALMPSASGPGRDREGRGQVRRAELPEARDQGRACSTAQVAAGRRGEGARQAARRARCCSAQLLGPAPGTGIAAAAHAATSRRRAVWSRLARARSRRRKQRVGGGPIRRRIARHGRASERVRN